MRSRYLTCLLVILMALLLPVASVLAADAHAGIAWEENFGKVLKRAKEESKPILIDFYTSWCVYCKQLDKESFSDPRNVELAKEFVCAKLDADVAKAAANRYPAEGYPTVIFATSTGDEILRFSGYRTADQVYTVMKTVQKAVPKIAENMARIKENKKDYKALLELGRLYLDFQNPERAAGFLKRAKKALPSSEKTGKNFEEAQADLLLLLGRAHAENEEYKKACKALDQLVACYPDSPKLGAYYTQLAEVFEAWGKDGKAADARAKAAAAAR